MTSLFFFLLFLSLALPDFPSFSPPPLPLLTPMCVRFFRYFGFLRGDKAQKGWIPSNFVRKITEAEDAALAKEAR